LAKKPGIVTKFQPLNETLGRYDLPFLPVDKSIVATVGTPGSSALVIAMNSCWGCGATEYIPAEFRESIGAAIEKVLEDKDDNLLRVYYDRQFDTPAISDDAITNLVQTLDREGPSQIAIVVAHHNILPQRVGRLAPYTELVNSGSMRSSLLETGRPILYLHGHIHDDPVEVISNSGGDSLVCISAPEAASGFNVIEIVFTRSEMPLTCVLTPWRFDHSGILRENETRSIPLIGRRRRSNSRVLARVYSHLLDHVECFWADLLSAFSAHFSENAETQLQELIELLLADERVSVDNYRAEPVNWIIRANI